MKTIQGKVLKPERYIAPKMMAVAIETSIVICNSDEQIQSYEEDPEQFRF